MKLLTRYNRINILLMGGIFLLASIAFYFALYSILIHEVDESLDATRTNFSEYVKTYNKLPAENPGNDDLLISYKPIPHKKAFKKKDGTVELYNRYEDKTEKYRQLRFCVKAGDTDYEITVARPLEGTTHLLKNIAAITIVTLFLIALVTTLANRIIFRKLWRPFYDALSHLKGYKIGSPAPLVLPATDTDEFVTMNAAMEFAMNKAGSDFLTLKEFTENASHEIQTPLAIIRTKLDLLSQETDLSEKQFELLQGAQTSISRLSRLNKSLLLLAKIENHQFDQVENIQLEEKLEDKLTVFKELWQNENIEVNAALEPAGISIDASLCDILLNNLLSNATNHNYPGGTIHITLAPGRLAITNTSHAPEANRQQLFRRFYKAKTSSTHHGLGLSIVKEICDLSHISIDYNFSGNQHTFTLGWLVPSTH